MSPFLAGSGPFSKGYYNMKKGKRNKIHDEAREAAPGNFPGPALYLLHIIGAFIS